MRNYVTKSKLFTSLALVLALGFATVALAGPRDHQENAERFRQEAIDNAYNPYKVWDIVGKSAAALACEAGWVGC